MINMYITLGIVIILLVIPIGCSIFNFKRKKKKYLPLEVKLTEKQKKYVLTTFKKQDRYQYLGLGNLLYYDIKKSIIAMVIFNKLDEDSLRYLNNYMSSITFNIGFWRIK